MHVGGDTDMGGEGEDLVEMIGVRYACRWGHRHGRQKNIYYTLSLLTINSIKSKIG
jgi:hypothetical protein